MDTIPQDLLQSLKALGLSESEARIYVALVLMNNAEAKDLIDFLGLSKPGTYESLRSLEDKGLIVLVNSKPITYQAVPPDIGLDILTETYVKAKEEAKDRFSTLDKNKVLGATEPAWCVFNQRSIEHKIRDMLRNAKKSVFLIASDKYVKHFTTLSKANLDQNIIIFSEDVSAKPGLKKLFKSTRANVQVVSTKELIKVFVKLNALHQAEFAEGLEETMLMFDFDNVLFLIVDDAEILTVPPLSGSGTIAFNLRDELSIANMKLPWEAMTSYIANERAKKYD